MLELPRFGEFDLVWALDDAINYLLSAEELERALTGMRANLAPTGLLLFDVNCAPRLPHLLRRNRGGRAGRAAADLARPGASRRGARVDLRIAARSRCSIDAAGDRGQRGTGHATASVTSPKPRCWRRWSAPAWSASTSTATASTASPSSRSTNRSTPRRSTSPAATPPSARTIPVLICLNQSGAASATCPASMGCGPSPCSPSSRTTWNSGGLRGGLLGVGIFFTLSGYLITDILLAHMARRDMRLRRLLARPRAAAAAGAVPDAASSSSPG